MSDFKDQGGVTQTGITTPTDTNDTYPVTDPSYSIGGFRNVSGGAAGLDSIPILRRRAGMVVGIDDGATYYKLKSEGAGWSFDITDWELFAPGGTVSNVSSTNDGTLPLTGPFNPSTSLSNNVGNVATVNAGGGIQYIQPGTKVVKVFAFENFDIPVFLTSFINIIDSFGDKVSARGEILEGIAGQRGDVVFSDVLNPTIPINFIVNGVEAQALSFVISCGDSFYIRKIAPVGTLTLPNIEVYITKGAENVVLATDTVQGSVPETGGASKAGHSLVVKEDGSGFEVRESESHFIAIPFAGFPGATFLFDVISIIGARTSQNPFNYTIIEGAPVQFTNSSAVNLRLIKNGVDTVVTNYNPNPGEHLAVYEEQTGDIVIDVINEKAGLELPAPAGPSDNQKILVVDPNGDYVLTSGLTGLTAIPPLGLPFAFPDIDFGPGLGQRVNNSPILYSIIDNGTQNTVDFVNSVSNLFLIKNGIRSTITNYLARQGEIIAIYEDFNSDIVLQSIDTYVKSFVYADSSNQTLWAAGRTTEGLINQQANIKEEYISVLHTPTFTTDYEISTSFLWSMNLATDHLSLDIFIENLTDSTSEIIPAGLVEAKDAAGTSTSLNIIVNGLVTGNINNGTDQRYHGALNPIRELTRGKDYKISLRFTSLLALSRAAIHSGAITLKEL